MPSHNLEAPRFVKVPKILHRFAGRRPKGLEGAIIHFDAGRTRSRAAPDDLEWGARNTLAGAVTGGHAYATVSRSGTIYLPANMDWDAWGSHAGVSKCPATGRTGVSRFYVGFEVNCPGWVYPSEEPDLFVPWFDAVCDAKGRVVADSKGRARIRNHKGEIYRRDQVRLIGANEGNIRKGAYVPFTTAQMDALVGALLWLKARAPATFSLDRVFGHDEVAVPAGRKLDPGGSLGFMASATIGTFRAQLAERWEGQGR
jgi:hypothetical protein